jgi:hypothetical protein
MSVGLPSDACAAVEHMTALAHSRVCGGVLALTWRREKFHGKSPIKDNVAISSGLDMTQ